LKRRIIASKKSQPYWSDSRQLVSGKAGAVHPYRLEGDVLVIDFEDPTLGVQRKRILRLTHDELEFKDEQYEASQILRKISEAKADVEKLLDGRSVILDFQTGWRGISAESRSSWRDF
jgi:hypothetical protein